MNTNGLWQYVEADYLAGTSTALPSACAQVQGSPRVKITGMNNGGIVHMDEVIFAPYRAALAIGAHGPKQCDGSTCPYTPADWWTANQAIAPLPNKALQTDKEFSASLPTSFSDTREQVVYEIAMTLANSRWVPQGLYDRAVNALGHVGVTDVITLMGYYTSVSMTLAFYDVPAGATGIAR